MDPDDVVDFMEDSDNEYDVPEQPYQPEIRFANQFYPHPILIFILVTRAMKIVTKSMIFRLNQFLCNSSNCMKDTCAPGFHSLELRVLEMHP